MLHRFKLRLLGVIVVITLVGLIMQSNHISKQVVEPVLSYIMNNKYDVGAVISRYVNIPSSSGLPDTIPASAGMVLQPPCDYWEVERGYGWYWDQQDKEQKFNPGMYLTVKDGTAIKPIVDGQVMEITEAASVGTVLVKHNADFYSLYGGLTQVLAEEGSQVSADDSLGTTSTYLYFEVRGKDGPVNPSSIFE